MATNTPLELVEYYQNLLIFQYVNKPQASGFIGTLASMVIMPPTSVQQITFSIAPTSGIFVLSYLEQSTIIINWNASAATIQTDLRQITGLENVTVTGSIASLSLVVTFTGVVPPAFILSADSNTLENGSTNVDIEVTEIDETLPLSVQDAFNLIEGTTGAQGVQLDILGDYVGVSRSGQGFSTVITLDDQDFLSLIRMAITKNSSGSSLATIQDFIFQFFAGQMTVFDYANMSMSYVISQTIGSQDLVQLFITEGLLPAPMGVLVTVFYVPTSNLFSFTNISLPALPAATGFNKVGGPYHGHWLSAHDLIVA